MDLFDDERLTTAGLLIEAHNGLITKLVPQLTEAGLGTLDFDALIRLARSPEQRLRMTDLAAQTSLSTSGVTRVVDRLERGGLVRRETAAGDRRSTFAVLTESGADRLRELMPRHLETIERWFTGLLDAEQLDALAAGLRIVRDAVRPAAGNTTTPPG